MDSPPTENEFSQHLNTKYRVNIDAPQPIELELVDVKSYVNKNNPAEQGGMERFSVYFLGSDDILLPQGTYRLTHERMGDVDLFLVPIKQEEHAFRYEAIFNYFIQK
jgi:Domain of unknown function (DUF6916)